MNFSKILVSWGKFKKALWSKTGWRDRDGGTLGASQKAQKADVGIHTAGQREDPVWTDWGLGMAVKHDWANLASAPEPGDPVQVFQQEQDEKRAAFHEGWLICEPCT